MNTKQADEPYNRLNILRAYDTRANSFSIQQVGLVFETAPAVEEGRRFDGTGAADVERVVSRHQRPKERNRS
jgi:hypothetical protein